MSRLTVLASLVLALALAACNTAPAPAPETPPISFAHKKPIRFDVAQIEIEDRYRPPLKAPNVEHNFPIPLSEAAQRWAKERFVAVGNAGIAHIIIEDAGATLSPLKTDSGVTGLFKRQQAEELRGRLQVRITITGLPSQAAGYAQAVAEGRRTIPENISLNERDAIYYEFTKAVVERLDSEMDGAIATHLQSLVR